MISETLISTTEYGLTRREKLCYDIAQVLINHYEGWTIEDVHKVAIEVEEHFVLTYCRQFEIPRSESYWVRTLSLKPEDLK